MKHLAPLTVTVFVVTTLVVLSLVGCSSNPPPPVLLWRHLPAKAVGVLVVEHGASLWLIRAGKAPLLTAPGGNYTSISPDGSLLLVDDQYFLSTTAGKQVGYIHSVVPTAGLQQSLWVSTKQIVVGSYVTKGLYAVGPTSPTAQALSSDCQLGAYTDQAALPSAMAVLCVGAGESLNIIYVRATPTEAPVLFASPEKSSVHYLSDAIWQPDGSHIVCVWGPSEWSTPPNHSDLLLMARDGTHSALLEKGSPGHFYLLPAWSPDGKTLAYVEEVAASNTPQITSFSIHLLTLAAHQDRTLATGSGAGPSALVWSPDGQDLAYDAVTSGGQPGQVTVVQIRSQQRTAVAGSGTLVGWAM